MKRILRLRKMTWVLLIWTVLMFAWMIGGASSASSQAREDCRNDPAVVEGILSEQACIDASDVGTGIGVTLIFFLWFIGFVVLGLIWLMTRPRHRQCPACGEDVKKGRTACPKCGHDFAAAAVRPQAVPAPPE